MGADLQELVRSVVKEFTDSRGMQAAFNDCILHDNSYEEYLLTTTYDDLKKVITVHATNSPDLVEFAIKHVILIAANHHNEETVGILTRILERLVTTGIVPARLTCESILDCEKLTYKNAVFWNCCFGLVRRIIGNVDYKGVREIMKICLEKLGTFTHNVPNIVLPQLNVLVELVEHIFDRDACLLPAYFIVNEILKSYPENRHYPHWTVSKLLSDFVDSFRPTAQIVTVIGRSKMLPVVENSGHAGYLVHSWKLDQLNLRFVLKGNLPYEKDLLIPQDRLLRYVLEQPYSRDMVCAILGLQKQHKMRCQALEERLVELIVLAMEKTETEMNQANENQATFDEISGSTLWLWHHLSTQLIFFVLFQFSSFPHIVQGVHDKLLDVKNYQGRDYLMWILLQFISGSIQKNPLSDFLPVLKLYDLLYPEKEAFPVPDMSKPYCTAQMAATCIWIHVLKKAQTDNTALYRPLPAALKKHYDFLQGLVQPNSTQPQLQMNDFRIALLCNAFSTNQEHFTRPMAALVETLHQTSNGNGTNQSSSPLSVQVLDSLTVHTKMSLIHNIVTSILKVAQAKTGPGLTPALVETYARLLVYMEIESLGIKGFITQLLPAVYKSQAWGILHTLLEMFCYRLHHIQPHYRVQLLAHLNSLAAVTQGNTAQLHLCVEMTALRLITGFNSVDIHSQLSRVVNEYKTLVSTDSEELNRALVLTIARAIHMTGTDVGGGGSSSGTWFRDILGTIMQQTPHSWSTQTLQCFPPLLADYFQQNQVPRENKQHLRAMVEEEFKNWTAMSVNEHELIEHFSMQGTPPLFLCIMLKTILDTQRVPPVAYKILEKIGPKGLSAHIRKLCDYVVGEFANAGAGQHVTKLTDTISDLVWKHHFVTYDRLLLCMALRSHEGNEAQVCFFVIHSLLLKSTEFKNRMVEFLKDNSPEHWKQVNWHEKHKSFNTKFPEVFSNSEEQQQKELPVYFGNVCLRFLPVFDIIIHRFLEITAGSAGKQLEAILENLGSLYKFHDRPITYLYNTLHYYEAKLRDKSQLKKKLVGSILGALKDIKPPNWALTEPYNTYLTGTEEAGWIPEMDYYVSLISRFVDVIEGKKRYFTGVDWRYNEFPNPAAHILHSTCVELMALPVMPAVAGSSILDVVMQGKAVMDTSSTDSCTDLESWFNATGLILVSLPDTYWLILHDRLISIIENLGRPWTHRHSPLVLFNFKAVHNSYLYSEYASHLAITHAVWHHLGTGHINQILSLVTERCLPIVKNETQLLFIAHLIGPFLQRLNSEKPQMVCRLTIALYELLAQIDQAIPADGELLHKDIFCDLLYHIKYMFTGDIVKNEIEPKIRNFRPALQMRLRFITHLNIEEIPMTTGSAAITTASMTGQGGILQPQITLTASL